MGEGSLAMGGGEWYFRRNAAQGRSNQGGIGCYCPTDFADLQGNGAINIQIRTTFFSKTKGVRSMSSNLVKLCAVLWEILTSLREFQVPTLVHTFIIFIKKMNICFKR